MLRCSEVEDEGRFCGYGEGVVCVESEVRFGEVGYCFGDVGGE